MIRIEVDYNTVTGDPDERFVIPARFHSSPDGALRPGQRALLFEADDYEVEATLEYDPARDTWYARPHWTTYRDLSATSDAALATANRQSSR